MKNLKLTVSAAALIAASASYAAAPEDSRWYLAPSAGFVITDDDRQLDDGYQVDLRFGRAVSNSFNFELGLFGAQLENDAVGAEDVDQFGFGADLLYIPYRGTVAPYALAGVGGMWTQVKGNGDDDSQVHPFAQAGLGVLWNLSENGTALRTEARYRTEFNETGVVEEDFSDWIVSVGLNIPLGSKAQPISAPVPADSDADGVLNGADQCPNTAPGASVDANGCELDSDADGVVNSRDVCPNTPAGTAVNSQGCELDSDNDGIVNSADQCPNTANGVRVDSKGCDLAPVVRLDGVNFKLNSSVLLPEARSVLVDAAGTLNRYPALTVEVAGHTDSTGDANYNHGLSQNAPTE
jgi:OOP family OmpA-OmpF porin